MKKNVLFFTTLTLTLGLFFLSACSKRKEHINQVRFRLPSDPPTIDWTLATDNVSKEIISPIHIGLVSHNSNSEITGELAEKWEISPDGKTYTFTLRPNLKWSDGEALTAEHFVDSWERLLNPATASEYSYFIFDVLGAEDYQSGKLKDFSKVGVKAPTPNTLVVTLRAASSYWVHVPAFWITYPIRKDVIAKHGDKWTDPANIVSAGPYKLTTFERDSRAVLEKNQHYYDQAALEPMPDSLVFRVIKDDTTAVALFNSGDIDVVRDLPPFQVPSLSKRPEFHSTPFLRGYYYGFNLKKGATQDINVRLAMAHAIDRTELEKVLGPMVKAAKYWNQPGLLGHDPNIGLDFNLEKAKEYLAKVKNPSKQVFEIWFDQKETNKLVAENIQAQLRKNLGIDVKLSSQEWKVYLQTLKSDTPAIWRLGWGADYPDPNNFLDLFTCTSGNNYTGFCNKKYDSLIIEAATETDLSKRASMYQEAEKILLEQDVAIVPLFSQTNMHLVSKKIQNFVINSMGDYEYNAIRLQAR